jgi:hypothetical protein
VGDTHQPLHDIDNHDQGGNCTTIKFGSDERPSNMHSIWDSRLIQYEAQRDMLTNQTYAASLDSRFAAKYATLATAPAVDPASWAWEGSGIARAVVYGNLEPEIPVEGPDSTVVCAAEREKVLALKIVIGEAYITKALPVVDEQLATAGFRLALLLNASL